MGGKSYPGNFKKKIFELNLIFKMKKSAHLCQT